MSLITIRTTHNWRYRYFKLAISLYRGLRIKVNSACHTVGGLWASSRCIDCYCLHMPVRWRSLSPVTGKHWIGSYDDQLCHLTEWPCLSVALSDVCREYLMQLSAAIRPGCVVFGRWSMEAPRLRTAAVTVDQSQHSATVWSPGHAPVAERHGSFSNYCTVSRQWRSQPWSRVPSPQKCCLAPPPWTILVKNRELNCA